MKWLIEFGLQNETGETYFRADNFCKIYHDNMGYWRDVRRRAVERAELSGDGPVVPVIEYDRVFYLRSPPRTVADLDHTLISGASGSLTRSSLSTLPADEGGVTLRRRFSVLGSEADYSETIDGDYSDFGEACGVYRR